ncbi:hypothetical protein GGX14DRAFT_643973 [Mycena pura]|uniref:Uncharacterized protein n=1 Tax=Mycena pura TaxID=153505 RepID=A0AAD6Y8W0_9AGAR|nr:hypothetical protein GGX14DRAFT_643973 [Mycena pura]
MTSDILNFRALSTLLAEEGFGYVRSLWHDTLSRVQAFPLLDLPVEIAISILRTATSGPRSGTYAALMQTSRQVATLARVECVPKVVVLSDRAAAISFFVCVSVHHGVGAGVRELWFLPALKSSDFTQIGPAILKACPNVTRLACLPDAVRIVCSDAVFRHTALVDVTLLDCVIPWEQLFATRHGAALFAQVRRLRLVSGPHPSPPPLGARFTALTDLSISARATTCVQPYLHHARFPRLVRIVATVPYLEWRGHSMGHLMSEPELADNRVCVVHCSKKWKEVDIWKEGPSSIWNLGATEWNARNGDNTRSVTSFQR